jgi:rfaE bifunctional protein kinase chain/domain
LIPPLTRDRFEQILAAAHKLSIGVIGDFTLDGYWHADMEQSQLSRETPLYPRPIVSENYSLGGAANVAWNLAALKVGSVWAFSVLGKDWRGAILRELLEAEGILTSTLLTQATRKTPFYGKVVLEASGRCPQEDARLDFINSVPLDQDIEMAMIARIESYLARIDLWIVADYQSCGVVTSPMARGLLEMAHRHPAMRVVVDSRDRAAEFQSLILKPNDIEASRFFFPDRDPASVPLPDLAGAALEHNRRTGQPIFITLGPKGCLVCDNGVAQTIPGVRVSPPIDTVGAGDTFLASLTTALAAGANPVEAACLANISASITVKKIGVTGAACPSEIIAGYNSWLADSETGSAESFVLRLP